MKATILLLSSFLFASLWAGDATEVPMAGDVTLVFDYSNLADKKSASLILETSKGRTEVWVRDSAEPVIVNGHVSADDYEEMELVTAILKGEILATVFKLSPGELKRVPAHYLSPHNFFNPRGVTAKNDFVVRTFSKVGGQWTPYLTFYPATLYGDLMDETPNDIEVLSKDFINLIYKGSWRIFGGDKYTSEGPYKFKKKEGSTSKQFRYSPEKRILFTVNSDLEDQYTEGAIWWTGIQDFEISDQSVRNDEFSLITKEREKKLEALGITRKSPVFASPVPDEHFELFRKWDEYLENK